MVSGMKPSTRAIAYIIYYTIGNGVVTDFTSIVQTNVVLLNFLMNYFANIDRI